MTLAAEPLVTVHLNPGELLIGREPREVSTVLGSCVAITLFHERSHLAAICHAMLPSPNPSHACQGCKGCNMPFKYLTCAVAEMAGAFRQARIPFGQLEVKMFGGSNLLGRGAQHDCSRCVGSANVQMARQLLQQEHLQLRSSNVGGTRGRKILFNTLTGEVLHKHLS